jgi:large subunit ribosomal protein L13
LYHLYSTDLFEKSYLKDGNGTIMKTVVVNEESIKREWLVIDAADQTLGRLASKAAQILIGKGKVAYSPNQDHGDYVIVINADKIKLTGVKPETKEYFRHSHYPGGDKYRSFKEQMELDPSKVIIHAIHGMVSKNARGRAIMRKLHVYAGETHPHAAQLPKSVSI